MGDMPQPATPPSVPPEVPAWYYVLEGRRVGPVEYDTMQRAASAGTVSAETSVWREGMKGWQPAKDTELAGLFVQSSGPPPLVGADVNNSIVWLLAFVPVISVFVQYLMAGAGTGMPLDYWWVPLVMNIGLAIWDARQLNQAGHDTEGLGVWAVFLVPVYLFKRASRLRQSPSYAWTWVVMFVLSLALL